MANKNFKKIEQAKDALIESSRIVAKAMVNATPIDITKWVTVIDYDTATDLYTIYCDGVEYNSTRSIGSCMMGDRVPMLCMGGDVNKRILLCDTKVDETKLSWWKKVEE